MKNVGFEIIYSDFLFIALFLVLGIIFIIGGKQEWKWLVDPPIENQNWNTFAKLNKWFGTYFVKCYVLLLGYLFTSFSLIFFSIIIDLFWMKAFFISISVIFFLYLGVYPVMKYLIISRKDIIEIKKYSHGFTETKNNKMLCNKCGYLQDISDECINCYHTNQE